MPKITPFLWFDNQAEEAANYYVSIFENAKITEVRRYGKEGPGPQGAVLTVAFEVEGQAFVGLNGGQNPNAKYTEAISFAVSCRDQAEVDRLWEALTADGGEPGPCGWLKDKYGVSWQIVPSVLFELLDDPDPEKSGRVMKAMLGMGKLDIQGLRDAYEGRA